MRLFLVRLFPGLGASSHKNSGYQNYGDSYGNKVNLESRAKTLVETVKSQSRPENGRIELQTMYEVRYSDDDDTSLVKMQELHHPGKVGNAGERSRSVNSRSVVSL